MNEPDLKCVNAHDRCFEGGPCPLCEVVPPARKDHRADAAADAFYVEEADQ